MKPVVLDASVALSWCFSDESNAYCDAVLDYVRRNSAIVPPVWPLEISNSLLAAFQGRRISLDEVTQFAFLFSRLPIRMAVISTSETLTKVLECGHSNSLSIYDASYLYLAVRERVPLATADRKLLGVTRRAKHPKLFRG